MLQGPFPTLGLTFSVVFYAFVAQHRDVSARGVRHQTLIRFERYGNCPDLPDVPSHFNFSEVVPYGKTLVARATFLLVNNYKRVTKTTAKIRRCADRNDPHCEVFSTWRFGEESCRLLTMKNAIWTPLFTFQPSMACPLEAGVYNQENVTLDVEMLKLVNFPETGYFKVSVWVEMDKIPKQTCFYFEFSFIKIRI